jgi:thioredoxin reductase (NADPH)
MGEREADVVIIGAGIAGMSAATTAARFGRRVIVVEQMGPGGQIINASHILNLPGFPAGISGVELGPLLFEQADAAGAEVVLDTVESFAVDGRDRVVTCAGETLRAPAVIVAAGSALRNLGVPGEEALAGRGVSHCASCDGPFFRGKRVCVVGGGDAAFDEALVLAEFASEVVIVHRGSAVKAQQTLVDRVSAHPAIQVLLDTVVEKILGDDAVTGAVLSSGGTSREEAFAAVFVFVGLEPHTAFLAGHVELDAAGHIETDVMMRTSLDGVFAAGDIRTQSVALLAAAAGDGTTAAVAAHRYLQGIR